MRFLVVGFASWMKLEERNATTMPTAAEIRLIRMLLRIDCWESGPGFNRIQEVSIQKKMHEIAGRTIVLADHTKIGNSSLIRMCPPEEIAALITDRLPEEPLQKGFALRGIQVLSAAEQDR